MKHFILLFFLVVNFASSFEYIRITNGKRNIITTYEISDVEKFVNFVLDGTFTDNLGNYGYFDNNASVILKNGEVVRLEGFGKTTYQNNEIIYGRGVRKQQEQNSGVGSNEVIGATGSLKVLIGMKCNYAVKFFNDYAFFLQKCKISDKQRKILSNLSNKY